MIGPLATIDPPWLWLIVAAVLGIAELVAPGVFLIWIGLAALVTGAAALLLPLAVPVQWLVFALATVASIYIGRSVLSRHPIGSTDPLLNERGARLVGAVVEVVEPIGETGGRVRVGDGVWSARGVHAGIGEQVRVGGTDGATLVVERL